MIPCKPNDNGAVVVIKKNHSNFVKNVRLCQCLLFLRKRLLWRQKMNLATDGGILLLVFQKTNRIDESPFFSYWSSNGLENCRLTFLKLIIHRCWRSVWSLNLENVHLCSIWELSEIKVRNACPYVRKDKIYFNLIM